MRAIYCPARSQSGSLGYGVQTAYCGPIDIAPTPLVVRDRVEAAEILKNARVPGRSSSSRCRLRRPPDRPRAWRSPVRRRSRSRRRGRTRAGVDDRDRGTGRSDQVVARQHDVDQDAERGNAARLTVLLERPAQVRARDRVAVRIARRVAERLVDPRFELLRERVLEPFRLGVHVVERAGRASPTGTARADGGA